MPEFHQLLLFIGAGLLLNLTPGPDVLYIVTRALKSGARTGVVAAFGITAGCFVHILAAALGVSALKWLGAAYLVYVGVAMLCSRKAAAMDLTAVADGADVAVGSAGLKTVFLQGFWTNALNPKVALFFLAFVPQFIAPQAADQTLAFLLLGGLFNFNGLWVNIGWALLGAWAGRRLGAVQQRLSAATRWLDRVAGVMFIGFGLKLALSERPAT
jgi:threonine/homoserine/homoserine lactone efflux protein